MRREREGEGEHAAREGETIMSGAREGERDKKGVGRGSTVARGVAGRNGGKSRVGTGVKRLEAVATAAAAAAA